VQNGSQLVSNMERYKHVHVMLARSKWMNQQLGFLHSSVIIPFILAVWTSGNILYAATVRLMPALTVSAAVLVIRKRIC
jgi:hypothetical protein